MKYFSKKKKKSGFTLIELLVSVSIIGIMAGLSMSAYPKFSEQISVTAETYKMLAYFRETQIYGSSAFTEPGTKYLYSFNVDNTRTSALPVPRPTLQRYRYEITNRTLPVITNEDYAKFLSLDDQPGEDDMLTIGSKFEIYKIIGIKGTVQDELDNVNVIFKRPNPDARIVGMIGSSYRPDATGNSGYDRLEITLRSKKNNFLQKKVIILATGQMYVNDW